MNNMNELIKELALDANMINYVDNETPRRYFISGNADIEDLEKFAALIVIECQAALHTELRDMISRGQAYDLILKHFGFFGVENE